MPNIGLRSPGPSRRLRVGLVIGVVLSIAAVVVGYRAIMVLPDAASADEVVDASTRVDAVVMFVGGRGERLEAALTLIDGGVAPVLVIPNGTALDWPEANALCRGKARDDVEVLCPPPEPNTTRGEARVIADLARRRGWDSLVMVTTNYHVSRARLLLERCHSGEVEAAEAEVTLPLASWVRVVTHEWLGHAEARALKRDC